MAVNAREAEARLSRLLERARQGEESVIAKAGEPIAWLVPVSARTAPRQPGSARGLGRVREDLDEPRSDDFTRHLE